MQLYANYEKNLVPLETLLTPLRNINISQNLKIFTVAPFLAFLTPKIKNDISLKIIIHLSRFQTFMLLSLHAIKKKEKFICTQCFLTTKNHIVTPFNPEISKQNHPQKKIT